MIDPHQQTSRPRFHPLVVDIAQPNHAPRVKSFRQATPAAELFINDEQVDYRDLVYTTDGPRPTLKINGVDLFNADYSMLKQVNAALDAAGAPKSDPNKNGRPYLPNERVKLLGEQVAKPASRLAWTYGEPFVNQQADGTFVGGYMRTFATAPKFARIDTTWAEVVKLYFPGSTEAEAAKRFRNEYLGTWCTEPRSTDEKPKPKPGTMLVKNASGKYVTFDVASFKLETDPAKKVTYRHSGVIADDISGSVAFTLDIADGVATKLTPGPLLALKHSIEDGIEQSKTLDYGEWTSENADVAADLRNAAQRSWDNAIVMQDAVERMADAGISRRDTKEYGLYRLDTKGDHDSTADRVVPAMFYDDSVSSCQSYAARHHLARDKYIIERVADVEQVGPRIIVRCPSPVSFQEQMRRTLDQVAAGFAVPAHLLGEAADRVANGADMAAGGMLRAPPGTRFLLATGHYSRHSGQYDRNAKRVLTLSAGEPGYLMHKAREWGLKHGTKMGDQFEWRVFDTRRGGGSINALAPIGKPLPLPPGFPLPKLYGNATAFATHGYRAESAPKAREPIGPLIARGMAYRVARAGVCALLGAGAIALLYHLI